MTRPPALGDELAARAWQHIAATTDDRPVTAPALADATRLTRGGALALLRQWAAAGHLTRHTAPGRTGPYLDTYTRRPHDEGTTDMPTDAPSATARVAPAAPARGAAGTVRRDRLVPAALAYAARGWHVFPLRPDDKRPAFPDHAADTCDRAATGRAGRRDARCRRAGRHVMWEERATTDPARIRAAWSAAPFGIGIACGPSGLVVVDLDTPKPDPATGQLPEPPEQWRRAGVRDGADVFALVCEAAGRAVPWDTYAVNTGSGGTHLYYAAPTVATGYEGPPLRNTSTGDPRALGWLIDTRAAGGYVVAPPSTAAGLAYTLAADEDTPAVPLPAWLADRLRPAELPPQRPITVALTAPRAGAGQDEGQRRAAYLRAAVDRTLAAVAAAEPGGRNRALYGAGVSLGQLVAGGELDPDSTRAALEAAGTAAGQSPREAAATVRSGMRAGANRPRHITTTPTTDADSTEVAA